ncbi:hypothetical protein [Kribbella sp. NPDC051137]|uniref:hypothetical protein n=1 Tax=Kribbella sp. NPDC051137 TaxID=3155045 RepID=UPI002F603557
MSNSDTIFLAASESLDETVGWIACDLRLERVDDPDLKEGQHFFRGRARTVDGTVLLVVGPNVYGEDDPEPEDVSAIDRYSAVVDVRIAGSRNEERQLREASAVFDELAEAQPAVALVLVHAMSTIIAAYLPGTGVQTFPADTSLDADDIDIWRRWVLS